MKQKSPPTLDPLSTYIQRTHVNARTLSEVLATHPTYMPNGRGAILPQVLHVGDALAHVLQGATGGNGKQREIV